MQKKVILSVVCSAVLSSGLFGFDLGSVASTVQSVAPAATTQKSIPSNPLLGQLSSQLGISNKQAAGGMGSILSFAKTKLPSNDFATLSKAVPNSNALMGLAPQVAGLSGMSGLASQFSSLGLSPDMISKFVPVIMNYFKSSGATGAMGIISKLF